MLNLLSRALILEIEKIYNSFQFNKQSALLPVVAFLNKFKKQGFSLTSFKIQFVYQKNK